MRFHVSTPRSFSFARSYFEIVQALRLSGRLAAPLATAVVSGLRVHRRPPHGCPLRAAPLHAGVATIGLLRGPSDRLRSWGSGTACFRLNWCVLPGYRQAAAGCRVLKADVVVPPFPPIRP